MTMMATIQHHAILLAVNMNVVVVVVAIVCGVACCMLRACSAHKTLGHRADCCHEDGELRICGNTSAKMPTQIGPARFCHNGIDVTQIFQRSEFWVPEFMRNLSPNFHPITSTF